MCCLDWTVCIVCAVWIGPFVLYVLFGLDRLYCMCCLDWTVSIVCVVSYLSLIAHNTHMVLPFTDIGVMRHVVQP